MTAAPALPDRDRLLELIVELAVVHGKVTLSSGREADWYIDMRRLTLHHEGAPLVGRVMRQVTGDLRYDVVGGLTLGADPVAAAMLHAAAAGEGFLDACIVRKEGKVAHIGWANDLRDGERIRTGRTRPVAISLLDWNGHPERRRLVRRGRTSTRALTPRRRPRRPDPGRRLR